MDRPEYFVVRVYRRARGTIPELEGVVEAIGLPQQRAFASSDELWAILLDPSLAQLRSSMPPGPGDR
jgi:hypothetical protein